MIGKLFKRRPANNTKPDENGHTSGDGESDDIVTPHERALLNNILKLRDIRVADMMIPRADIIATDIHTTRDELIAIVASQHISRLPVYEDTLDNVMGTVHIRDIVASLSTQSNHIDLRQFLIDVPIVSPTMPALDLILEMRLNKRHMVLVVDEYGGIDGLITLGDIIETIVGEINDEHDDHSDEPQIIAQADGTWIADGRIDIHDFEEQFGIILTDSERDEVETLGGLAFTIAGRIPGLGEILKHSSGLRFEILEADPRRIYKVRIRR